MSPNHRTLAVPLLLIVTGTGWLLSVLGIAPEIDWVWTLALALIGVMTFVSVGFDKGTLVIGGFFLVTSILSVLRQTGRITFNAEVPVLLISVGVLMLIARHPAIPRPGWIVESRKDEQ
ncbi:MAG: hypothetical protein R3C19_04895 [Planctomycetaceae bacterium]